MGGLEILERLVAFPSVVGAPNGAIVEWVRDYLAGCGVAAHTLPGPEGDRANLFATIGPANARGYVLSGHMDVVPAGEADWTSDPFRLTRDGNRLIGRGASDMKGFLAAALAVVPILARLALTKPIHLAFSYDEEAGCRGAPHLLARLPELCAPPLGAVIGEPTGLQAIRAHKGKAAARLTLTGRAGHSSRPDQGLNAIHGAAGVLTAAVSAAATLAEGPFDDAFEPPFSSLQVGVIRGGRAVNVIPETVEIELEARAIAGVDPVSLLRPVQAAADALRARGYGVDWRLLAAYPALSLPAGAPLARLLEELTAKPCLAAVSYGSEAGLFQAAGVPAILCGPGDIARAHRANEYLRVDELNACEAMIEALGRRCTEERSP